MHFNTFVIQISIQEKYLNILKNKKAKFYWIYYYGEFKLCNYKVNISAISAKNTLINI